MIKVGDLVLIKSTGEKGTVINIYASTDKDIYELDGIQTGFYDDELLLINRKDFESDVSETEVTGFNIDDDIPFIKANSDEYVESDESEEIDQQARKSIIVGMSPNFETGSFATIVDDDVQDENNVPDVENVIKLEDDSPVAPDDFTEEFNVGKYLHESNKLIEQQQALNEKLRQAYENEMEPAE